MTEPFQPFLQRCVSVDLEVDPASATIFAFAAVRDDARPPILAKKRDLMAALDPLEAESAEAEYLLGHNIIRHDLPHLVAVRPKLANIFRSPIDTLWLNPLAFPRNPYHHLVKHYHDGRLQAGHVNDPEMDARLVFQVDGAWGAVVYCATRRETQRLADFLKQQGLSAERFHAGLTPEEKRNVQERFRIGELRIIAATNAFGMGIDKPDIRLVVHGDIPGSLENYLQEAGRAGRDRSHANCVLLFAAEDVERQFSLSARSRLARHEIGAILKALRRLDDRMKKTGTVVATSGEIVRAERDQEFEGDSATDDTRVKTAVSWLEEATLLSREENRVQVFPPSLRIRTVQEAEAILAGAAIPSPRRKQLLDIARHLMNAPPDRGISTDEL